MRSLCTFLLVLSMPGVALAQTWPADADWRVLRCGGVPSFDAVRDEPGATGERDVVGDTDQPALYIASDATHLYFRMRVDADPLTGAELRPFGWAVEFDTDADRTTYELLLGVDGIVSPEEVIFRENTMQRTPNDPADPPESTITTYPAMTHARGVPAEGGFASSFGGDPDFFVDWAAPFSDLSMNGVSGDTTLVLVMGTSSSLSNQAINADIACHDDSTGPGTITSTSTDPVRPDGSTVPDSDGDGLTDAEEVAIGTNPDVQDTDGDGWNDGDEVRAGTDPNDPNSFPSGTPPTDLGVRGGPGACAVSAASSGGPSPLLLIGVALFALRRNRRRRS